MKALQHRSNDIQAASREPLFSKSDVIFAAIVCLAIATIVPISLGFLNIPKDKSASSAKHVAKDASKVFAGAPSGGSISGKVHFSGSAPKLPQAKTTGFEMCGSSHSYDRLVVGKGGGVEYTLIYVNNPPAGKANFPPPTIKQEGCGYSPHMSIATRGSSVSFVNNDPGLHNVHGYYISGSDRSTLFNFAQATQGQQSSQQLRKAGMVGVECDVHFWMSSWIWVTDNPYVAVTKADGTYSIDGLPAGTYNVIMWHEGWKPTSNEGGRPQFSGAVVEQRQVTVTEGGTTSTDFELK
jgi:plastocyanin